MGLVGGGGGGVGGGGGGLGGAHEGQHEALKKVGALQVAVVVDKDVHQQLPALARPRQAPQRHRALPGFAHRASAARACIQSPGRPQLQRLLILGHPGRSARGNGRRCVLRIAEGIEGSAKHRRAMQRCTGRHRQLLHQITLEIKQCESLPVRHMKSACQCSHMVSQYGGKATMQTICMAVYLVD